MINNILNRELPKAYDKYLADAVHPFTGHRKGEKGEYDPVTDTYVEAPAVVYGGRGVIGEWEEAELQATEIDITDVKFSCLQIECSDEPMIGDLITLRGKKHRIFSVQPSPTDLKWVMGLRGLNVGQ